MIRRIEKGDVAACLEIYNYYILNSTATLEENALTLGEFEQRVERTCADDRYCWLVYEQDGELLGYAYLDKFNPRSAYRISCDLSIYVKNGCGKRGIGRKLFEAVSVYARAHGIECVISLVTAENAPSRRFHEKLGFELAGELADVAYKFDRYIGLCFYLLRLSPPQAR